MPEKYILDEDEIINKYCIECVLLAGGMNPRQRNDCYECFNSLRIGQERVDITIRYKRMKGY
jgi:hypothetical protein